MRKILKIFILGLIIVTITPSISFVKNYFKIQELKEEEQRIDKELKEKEQLLEEIKDDKTKSRLYRQQYKLSKDDEIIFIFPEEEDEDEITSN